ncbi:MAG TPA: hypothetical protein VKZ89_06785 [Thermobifida alba]|nr:hypothetical protein [Thermobifida alba]
MKTIRKQRPRRRRAPDPDDTAAAPARRERTRTALDDAARVLDRLNTTLRALKEH